MRVILIGACLLGVVFSAQAEQRRIVSFSPALSRIVVDLDLAEQIVGVGEHDTQAPAGLPVAGNFLNIDCEMLLSLSPTHVLFPQTTTGVPDALTSLSDGRFSVSAFEYPTTIEQSLDNIRGVGKALGELEKAEALRTQVFERLEAVRQACADRSETTPTVLLAFAANPVWASGPGSVNDDLLALIGARNALADHASSAVTLDAESLIALAPQVIVLLRPGEPALADSHTDARLRQLADLPIPAITERRVALLNGHDVLLPASNLPGLAAALGEAVWPEHAERLRELRRDWP
jgi:iron complex transport system substrate-binding protein